MREGDDEIERLRQENERLRGEVDGLRGSEPSGAPPRRVRRLSAWVMLVVACLLAVVSVLVVFVRNEALNTDAYVSTVQPLASNPAIQTAVANKVADSLISKVDVNGKVKGALPARAGFLAAPITSGLDTAVHQITLRLVQSQAFQTLWTKVNRQAHQQLVNLLTGTTTGPLASDQGKVTLHLGTVAADVKKQLDSHGITIFDRVPTGNGPTLVLFESAKLAKAQRLIRALNRLALVLPAVTIIFFVGSILLAIDRRKGFVRAAAGLAVSMVLMLIGSDVGRSQYLHALSKTLPLAAAAASFDIVTANPLRVVRIILIVSVVAAVVAAVVGNPWVRDRLGTLSMPSWLVGGPFVRFVTTFRTAVQWVVAGVGALVLLAWVDPTPLAVVVVLVVVLAVEALVAFVARRPAIAPQS